jgi:16S rRNA (uracil1498-N3)-methyltransferase
VRLWRGASAGGRNLRDAQPPSPMTTTFYAPPDHFAGGRVRLPEDEARHAVRVLRHGVGDELVVVDGEGGRHRVRLTRADKQAAEGEVLATEREVGEPPFPVRIALAPLKQPARFETFVEKAVELGVTEIVPLLTARTEQTRLKGDRLHGILVAAMKQSGRTRLPTFRDPTPLRALLDAPLEGLRLICHEAAAPEAALAARLAEAPRPLPVTALVGPEGGFTEAEVAEAEAAGWAVVSLGPRRLRAETAALTVAAAVMVHAAR